MPVVARRIRGKEFHEHSHGPDGLDFVQLSGPDDSGSFFGQDLLMKWVKNSVAKCPVGHMDQGPDAGLRAVLAPQTRRKCVLIEDRRACTPSGPRAGWVSWVLPTLLER